jgi:hypothetical protein
MRRIGFGSMDEVLRALEREASGKNNFYPFRLVDLPAWGRGRHFDGPIKHFRRMTLSADWLGAYLPVVFAPTGVPMSSISSCERIRRWPN